MDACMVEFSATCIDAPDLLSVMDTVYISLRASLRREGPASGSLDPPTLSTHKLT